MREYNTFIPEKCVLLALTSEPAALSPQILIQERMHPRKLHTSTNSNDKETMASRARKTITLLLVKISTPNVSLERFHHLTRRPPKCSRGWGEARATMERKMTCGVFKIEATVARRAAVATL